MACYFSKVCYNESNEKAWSKNYLKKERMMDPVKNFTFEVPVVTPGKSEYTATLTAYVPTNGLALPLNKNRPAVVIFPGGGYAMTYDGEAEPIALKFTAAGIAAFVLRYSCKPAVFPQALCEGLWCVKYVRDHAKDFGINPKNIATLGFSAGGHLCASTGTLWNQPFLQEYLPGNAADYRPDKLILCYPVIMSHGACHAGSFHNLLGEKKDHAQLLELNSLDLQVGPQNPPAFLWHTFEDNGVSVENSMAFASHMVKCGIPIEMHIYPHGGHGLCAGDYTTCGECSFDSPMTVHEWLTEAIRFSFDEAWCS